MNFYLFLLLLWAIFATGKLIWAVGFSRRWRNDAKDYLHDQFPPGPTDEEIAEEARQDSVVIWFVIAAAMWLIFAASFRAPQV